MGRKIVRKIKKGYKGAKKFYKKHKGAINTAGYALGAGAKMAYQIYKLQQMVNAEKKRLDLAFNSLGISQCIINATGTQAFDITPAPVQGVAFNQRTGSSIKLCSAYFKMKFWQQLANTHQMKIRIEIWCEKGDNTVPATMLTELYQVSTMSGIIDYDSQIDPDYRGTARKIFTKNFSLCGPSTNTLGIKDLVIPLKWKGRHVRFNDNGTTPTDGALTMFIFADSGNTSGTVSTLANIPVTSATSGALANLDLRYYYYDN